MVKTTLGIEGMACEMCEAHVNDAIRKICVVKSAKADRRKHHVVIISDDELDETRVRDAIAQTGYKPTTWKSEPYEKKRLFGIF